MTRRRQMLKCCFFLHLCSVGAASQRPSAATREGANAPWRPSTSTRSCCGESRCSRRSGSSRAWTTPTWSGWWTRTRRPAATCWSWSCTYCTHADYTSITDEEESLLANALPVSAFFRADQGRFLDYIVSWGNLTEEKVALYLRDILEALHYLHSWRIAHLDLKVKT